MAEQYGLIIPNKSKINAPLFQATRNVFGSDSDSDDGQRKKPVTLEASDSTKRQAKKSQLKAVTEDPTVYQYDELYEEMTTKKMEAKVISKEDKKPRYIEKLMETANKRKRESERRIERQVQKEREKEGDEFADKESFVTSAYKKKMEELRLDEEKEKREAYLEDIGDVTKQKDLGGFYRHIYEQKLGTESKNSSESKVSKSSKASKDQSRDNEMNKPDLSKTSRNYRKRKSSGMENLSEGEILSDDEVNRVNVNDIKSILSSRKNMEPNIDADSDFSIDESSDEDETTKANTVKKEPFTKEVTPEEKNKDILKIKNEQQEEILPTPDETVLKIEPKVKIDIWKKRTVGDVFEQALKNYYLRKASKCQ